MNAPETDESSKPRFEFRSFGHQFDSAHQHMARLSIEVPEAVRERHSEEIYIVSPNNDINNVKIRNGKIDIKRYIQTLEGLEQWEPVLKAEFPLKRSLLLDELIPALQVELDLAPGEQFTLEAFLALVQEHPELQAVDVEKQRFGYMVHDTICEFGAVLINGTQLATINSESTERDAVHKTLTDIGLEGVENINYLQAIKRVIGMIDKPLAN